MTNPNDAADRERDTLANVWRAPQAVRGDGYTRTERLVSAFRFYRSRERLSGPQIRYGNMPARLALKWAREHADASDGRSMLFGRPVWTRGGSGDATAGAPMPDGGRWIENPRAAGFRLVRECDSAWYVDSDFQDEAARGAVYQLPARRGRPIYVPAVLDPFNSGPAILYPLDAEPGGLGGEYGTGYSIETGGADSDALADALRAADNRAEAYAEREREYRDAWQAGSRAAAYLEEIREAGREGIRLIRDWRRQYGSTAGLCAPADAVAQAVRERLDSLLDDRRVRFAAVAALREQFGSGPHGDAFADGFTG